MENNFLNADEALKENEDVAVLTCGTSMQPLLRQHKDIVVLSRITQKINKNDVVLYRRKGLASPVLHRVVKVVPDGYVIRGDNTFYKETDIKDDDIKGIMTAFYRNGKYVNCRTSTGYKFYVFANSASYPLRFAYNRLWTMGLKRIFSKIKRKIVK